MSGFFTYVTVWYLCGAIVFYGWVWKILRISSLAGFALCLVLVRRLVLFFVLKDVLLLYSNRNCFLFGFLFDLVDRVLLPGHSLRLVLVFSSLIGVPFVLLCCLFFLWKNLLLNLVLLLRMLLLLLILWVCCKIFWLIRVALVVHFWFEICHMLCFLVLWMWLIARGRIRSCCMSRFSCVGCFGVIFLFLLVVLINTVSFLYLCPIRPTGICLRNGFGIWLFRIRFSNLFSSFGFLCLFCLLPLLSRLVWDLLVTALPDNINRLGLVLSSVVCLPLNFLLPLWLVWRRKTNGSTPVLDLLRNPKTIELLMEILVSDCAMWWVMKSDDNKP